MGAADRNHGRPLARIRFDNRVRGRGGGTFDARSAADGKVLWSKPLASRTTPVVSGGVVFVVAGAALRALDVASGRDRWSVDVGAGPVHASAQAGRIVVASSTAIGAFRAIDGSTVWQRALGASVTVPPVIEADRVFLALSDGRVVGLNLATGETIWTVWLTSAPTGLLVGNGLLYLRRRRRQALGVYARPGPLEVGLRARIRANRQPRHRWHARVHRTPRPLGVGG